MEQTASLNQNHHAGWSEQETNLLWETADEAQQQGLPLRQVFEQIATRTGRRPNSIRNFYYAQVRQREDGEHRAARFIPFTEPEVQDLVEKVLRGRAQGQSVRACLQALSDGDHSLMLRYQNKYRSVLKNRPELIREKIEQLKQEGISCEAVEIHARSHFTPEEAVAQLCACAQKVSDPEIVRACDVFSRLILKQDDTDRSAQADRLNVRLDLCRLTLTEQTETLCRLREAVRSLTQTIKDFVIKSPEERADQLSAFCDSLIAQLGALESQG